MNVGINLNVLFTILDTAWLCIHHFIKRTAYNHNSRCLDYISFVSTLMDMVAGYLTSWPTARDSLDGEQKISLTVPKKDHRITHCAHCPLPKVASQFMVRSQRRVYAPLCGLCSVYKLNGSKTSPIQLRIILTLFDLFRIVVPPTILSNY